MNEIWDNVREWWNCLSTEERYYAMLVAAAVLSFVARLTEPSEKLLRVRIES
jgi:hypothetical protein